MRRHTPILICCVLRQLMLGIFSYTSWMSLYILWGCVYSDLLLISKSTLLFSHCWILSVLRVFWIQSFFRYVYFEHFSSCCLSFHYLNSFFHGGRVVNFNEIRLTVFFFPFVLLILFLSHCQTSTLETAVNRTTVSFKQHGSVVCVCLTCRSNGRR